MWKPGQITGIAYMAVGLLLLGQVSMVSAGKITTTTRTRDSRVLGPDVAPGGPVKNGVLTTIGKFMQADLNTWVAGKDYAPRGRVGALTNNPQNCILDAADGGYNHRSDTGAQSMSSSGCTTAYFSSSPQTAPPTGLIFNSAVKPMSSHISLAVARGSKFAINGAINFSFDPTTGVSHLETNIIQNMFDMGGNPGNASQDFVLTFGGEGLAGSFVSLPTDDEVADQAVAGNSRHIPWSVSINQAMLAPNDNFTHDSGGTTNGVPLGSVLFDTVPGYLP